MSSTTITVLIEETTVKPLLNTQHGLSLWMQADQEHVLIDAGQDDSFLENARKMAIDLTTTSQLFLTHGHYDHAGGIPALLETGVTPTITVHPQAWEDRLSCPKDAPPHAIGIPWSQGLLDDLHLRRKSSYVACEISPGIWSTGSIPNFIGLKASPYYQRKRREYWHTDHFTDEQSLVLKTERGLVVITGCCHAGVINTLLMAQCVTGIPQIYSVIGGLHLHSWEDKEITGLASDLQAFHLQYLWVNHCTGQRAFDILRAEIGARVAWAGTGTSIELPALFKEHNDA